MTEQDALAEACRVGLYLTEYDDPNPEEAARQLLAALPPDAHLFTVESLAAALTAESDDGFLPDLFVEGTAEHIAAAIIKAAKEAERE